MKVAILGAPQTGKTQLALTLKTHLLGLSLHIDVCDTATPECLNDADVVLLCGLDLKPASDQQQAADATVRATLKAHKTAFQVVYGQGTDRLANALFCLGRQFPHVAQSLKRVEALAKWHGACETCGDGDCEHRLFTGLVQR